MAENSIKLPDFITVRDLAQTMEVSPINVIKQLMSNGIMANINQEIDYDTASIIAEEMGFTIESATEVAKVEEAAAVVEKAGELAWRKVLSEEVDDDLLSRPSVVTIPWTMTPFPGHSSFHSVSQHQYYTYSTYTYYYSMTSLLM